MASSSGSSEDQEVGTPDERKMEEWAAVTSKISEKLMRLEKDNDNELEVDET